MSFEPKRDQLMSGRRSGRDFSSENCFAGDSRGFDEILASIRRMMAESETVSDRGATESWSAEDWETAEIDLDALAEQLLGDSGADADVPPASDEPPWRELESLLGFARETLHAGEPRPDAAAPQPPPESAPPAAKAEPRPTSASGGLLADAMKSIGGAMEQVSFGSEGDDPRGESPPPPPVQATPAAAPERSYERIRDIEDIEEDDETAELAEAIATGRPWRADAAPVAEEIATAPDVEAEAAAPPISADAPEVDDAAASEAPDAESSEAAAPATEAAGTEAGESAVAETDAPLSDGAEAAGADAVGDASDRPAKSSDSASSEAESAEPAHAEQAAAAPPAEMAATWRNEDPRNQPDENARRAMEKIRRRVLKVVGKRKSEASASRDRPAPHQQLRAQIGVYRPRGSDDPMLDDGAAPDDGPIAMSEAFGDGELPPEILMAIDGPPNADAAATPAPAVAAPQATPGPARDGLEPAADDAAEADATASAAPAVDPKTRAELKSLLAGWLDQNLPAILEQLMREEMGKRDGE